LKIAETLFMVSMRTRKDIRMKLSDKDWLLKTQTTRRSHRWFKQHSKTKGTPITLKTRCTPSSLIL